MRLGFFHGRQSDFNLCWLFVAYDDNRNLAIHRCARNDGWELAVALHPLTVEGHDDVSALDSSAQRGRRGKHLSHQGTVVRSRFFFHDLREFANLNAQPASLHVTRGVELGQNLLRHVDRNREANGVGLRIDRGVDSDDLTCEVDERSARIAGVDRGVRLNEVVVTSSA